METVQKDQAVTTRISKMDSIIRYTNVASATPTKHLVRICNESLVQRSTERIVTRVRRVAHLILLCMEKACTKKTCSERFPTST